MLTICWRGQSLFYCIALSSDAESEDRRRMYVCKIAGAYTNNDNGEGSQRRARYSARLNDERGIYVMALFLDCGCDCIALCDSEL